MATFKIENVSSFKEKICKLYDASKEKLHILILEDLELYNSSKKFKSDTLSIPLDKFTLFDKTYKNIPYIHSYGFVTGLREETIKKIKYLNTLIKCIDFCDSKDMYLSDEDISKIVDLERFVKERDTDGKSNNT